MKLVTLDQVPDIPNSNGDGPTNDNSWQPENLLDLAANPPEPPSIGGLLYPGKRTVLSGETESMKTWLALILAKAELDAGYPVAWVDLDAMGPGAMLERLQLLGVDDDRIGADFLYYQPTDQLSPTPRTQLTDTIHNRGIRYCVIDAFNPILSLHGLEPNSTPDIETFWRTIADPIANAGAAPVLLDHVVKNSENRGKYAYGSERKASGAIVHIGFRLLEALTKGGRGRSVLSVHKDRPGYLPRPTIGRLVLTSDNETIGYEIEPDKSHDEEGGFRPTVLMERISRYLEQQPDPVSQNQIENGVPGNGEAKRKAVETLAEEGYAAKTVAQNRAKLFASIKAYRETSDSPTTGSSPVRPRFVLDLRSTHSSEFVQLDPHGGRRTNQRETKRTSASNVRPDDVIHEYERAPFDDGLIPYEEPE